jgi:prepilin-type N-terminal cleavage/methylation domain-containing protein
MSTKTKHGFTLIELIVVFAIIALLTTVVIASLNNARQKGSDAGKIRALAEVRNALNVYFNDSMGGNGTYPGGNDLTILVTKKYVTGSIDSNIKYQGTNAAGTACNSVTGCTSYHLAVPLTDMDNKVLASDKDSMGGNINGKYNCGPVTTPITPDSCYDITP